MESPPEGKLTCIQLHTLQISAGVKIGTATHSGCMNHIHVAFMKEGGFIDPTRFFGPRPFTVPVWEQKCDEYKLVWKVSLDSGST